MQCTKKLYVAGVVFQGELHSLPTLLQNKNIQQIHFDIR